MIKVRDGKIKLTTEVIKNYIVFSFLPEPHIALEISNRHGVKTIPFEYLSTRNWKRISKRKIRSEEELEELCGISLSSTGHLPASDMEYYLRFNSQKEIEFPIMVRGFVHCATDNSDDTMLTVISNEHDETILLICGNSD